MDPVTLALLVRLAGDLGVSLISILKALGKDNEARSIQAILASSDDVWARVLARGEG